MPQVHRQGEPVWTVTAPQLLRQEIVADKHADVCIVGAGIAGLTTAYLLAREGRSVIVVDDGPIGGGQTAHTTAHLSNVIDDRYSNIESMHGKEGSRLAAASHTAAIAKIEEITRREKIECGFKRLDGYLCVPSGQNADELNDELAAAHRAGLESVELLPQSPLGDALGACLHFPHQGQFHPLKYLAGLTHAIERLGGQIFTRSHVEHIKSGTTVEISIRGKGTIKAGSVVVATNSPINDLVAIHTKQAPYLTYVIAALVPRGSVPVGLYYDTLDPYHYLRLCESENEADGDLLIIGGEDHKTGQEPAPEQRFKRLEEWARPRFPQMSEITYRWSGQVMESIDGLAFIGRNPSDKPNSYIITGDSGMGMTHGTIGGILLTDLIVGRPNAWETLYDPSRKSLRAAGEFVRENANVAAQYTDWLTGGDVRSTEEIAVGTGAVMRRGLSKVAVYRDHANKLHECSAVCPHLGCVVRWNGADSSWDCPCHGSRFDPEGHVTNGPANQDLKPISVDS